MRYDLDLLCLQPLLSHVVHLTIKTTSTKVLFQIAKFFRFYLIKMHAFSDICIMYIHMIFIREAFNSYNSFILVRY